MLRRSLRRPPVEKLCRPSFDDDTSPSAVQGHTSLQAQKRPSGTSMSEMETLRGDILTRKSMQTYRQLLEVQRILQLNMKQGPTSGGNEGAYQLLISRGEEALEVPSH